MSLTVLHLGAELALLGVLKDRVVTGVCALHGPVAAGLVKQGAIPTRGRAAKQGPPLNSPAPWAHGPSVRWEPGLVLPAMGRETGRRVREGCSIPDMC